MKTSPLRTALTTLSLCLLLAACTHEGEPPRGGPQPPFTGPGAVTAPPAATPKVVVLVVTAPPAGTAAPVATAPPAVTTAPVVTAPPSVTAPPTATAPATASAPPAVPTQVSQCTLKGSQPLAKGTVLYDGASGGRIIAEFSGAVVPLQVSEIPFDPSNGRARLATSNGGGSVRLDGYVSPSSVTVYAVKDIPVAAGHVWIADGQRVRLSAASTSQLTAELTIAGSQSQSAKGSAGCESYSLQRGSVTTFTVPGNGRGYQMSSTSLELFDDANATAIYTLNMADASDRLFWSTETKSGFVHLQYRADIVIDAWARATSLTALKKGETMDQLIPGSSMVTGAQLALDKPPPLKTASRSISIRSRRDEKEKAIGVIESGAEFYVIETMVGWSNILPKHLGVTPPAGAGFWILSSDVPN
jgi:hypothetical protein